LRDVDQVASNEEVKTAGFSVKEGGGDYFDVFVMICLKKSCSNKRWSLYDCE